MRYHLGFYSLILLTMSLAACGGGGGGGGSSGCDTPLTGGYINNELTTEPLFTNQVNTATNTNQIHDDGNQHQSYDINQIFLTKIGGKQGDTLALSYNVYTTQPAPTGSYAVFYIDTDNNLNTGFDPGHSGAEIMIADPISHSSDISAAVYTWNSSAGWVANSTLGTTSTTASYLAGCTSGISIFIPWYTGLANLNLTNAHGFMVLTTFANGDPNTPNPPIDQSSVFAFSFP